MKGTEFLTDEDDPIDIRIDGVFKAVFTKDTPAAKRALSKLVSALIRREITIETILANEPPMVSMGDIQLRLDINCRAENGELINVEMCFNPQPFEPTRMEYHVAKLYTGQDIKGKDKGYKILKQTYQISIISKDIFFQDERYLHTFEYYDPVSRISLNGRTRIIALELSKLDKIAEKPTNMMSVTERWAVYLEYLTDRKRRGIINEIVSLEEGIAMASSVLLTISRDEEERARILRAEKTELDYIIFMGHAKEVGLAEGREQGLQQGLEQGLQQGREKAILETAWKMQEIGLTAEQIKAATGITLDIIP